jgi:AcrR family transcriptional regulator
MTEHYSTIRSVDRELELSAVPRKPDRETRRREIVKAAAGVFDSEGYHTTNLETVAQAAGIKKPTLYHYFSSKDEILFEIHEELIDHLIAKQEARSGMSASDVLREVIADVMENISLRREYTRVFFEHFRELAPEHRATIAARRDRYAAMIEAEIQRGIESGEFRPIDVRLTMLAFFGMLNWAYQWYHSDGPLTREKVSEFFFELLCMGISAPPA